MSSTISESKQKEHTSYLKNKYGRSAEFISKDDFKFNIFDDTWTLNGLGNTGQTVSLMWLHNSKLSNEDRVTVRFAFAHLAAHKAFQTVHNVLAVISNIDLSGLELNDFKSILINPTENEQKRTISFIFALYAYDPIRYWELFQWANTIDKSAKIRKIYDPEKGALSDLENNALNVTMNQKIKTLMERGFEADHNKENLGLGLLLRFRTSLAARFNQVLVRRPANLLQLKWSDISIEPSLFSSDESFKFSDDDELYVRMFKAKQGGKFRQYPESEPLIINNAIAKEVLHYQYGYKKLFTSVLSEQNIFLNEEEFKTIFLRLPLFFTDSLFKTKFKDKSTLFQAFSDNGSGFHVNNTTLGQAILKFFKALGVISERVPADKFAIGNNRLRHTVGTTAARDNVHVNTIAKILGNSPASAKVYVDLSDETRAMIDDKFIANEFLANAFTTSISDLIKSGEVEIEDNYGNTFGKSKSVNQCVTCQREKPIGCYGCNNFSALASGDHQSQRDKAQQKYDYRIKSGDAPHALLELKKQIQYIDATILACNEFIRQQTSLEASNEN
ncbi:MAG: hypothetical protein ACPGR2_01950 [Psychrobium sp.]